MSPLPSLLKIILVSLPLLLYGRASGDEPLSLSSLLTGGDFRYIVQRGDSLTSVGARFGVPIKTLAANNGLAPNALLIEGQNLSIDNRHIVPAGLTEGILINIPQRMLFYMKEGQAMQSYPVGLGRPDWPTPTGRFTVITKEENPVWDVPKSIQEEMRRDGQVVEERVPSCPENPLGKHWLGLSVPGYGIHGTIAPASIYQFRTHGCIRLHADDIAALFPELPAGTSGLILYQRLLVARVGERIFLEAHPDPYGKDPSPQESLVAMIATHNLAEALDWEIAKEIIAKQEGVAREVTKKVAPKNIYHE
jgi:L,D-transpeptidase ErfK/SrfK